jgi:hypothetical protein
MNSRRVVMRASALSRLAQHQGARNNGIAHSKSHGKLDRKPSAIVDLYGELAALIKLANQHPSSKGLGVQVMLLRRQPSTR